MDLGPWLVSTYCAPALLDIVSSAAYIHAPCFHMISGTASKLLPSSDLFNLLRSRKGSKSQRLAWWSHNIDVITAHEPQAVKAYFDQGRRWPVSDSL